MALIEIQRLTKRFSSSVVALQDVSLSIEQGEIFCLMGPNGAGKTTLLKILAGLLLPSAGSVRIDGMEVLGPRARALQSRMGFASGERPGFYEVLTGRENLEFFAALYGFARPARRARIDALVERFGITSPDQPYQHYSTGMKQRLLLARTLLHDPAILLLDEPTRSLDPAQRAMVHRLMKEAMPGKTIVFTTHHALEAEQMASRTAVLHQGVVQADAG